MSITKGPFQKAAQQIEATCGSNLQVPTVHTNATLIRASNSWPVSDTVTAASSVVVGDLKITAECGEVVAVQSSALTHPAYDCSLDFLEDLWVTRFGHDWTDYEEIRDDAFFEVAYLRLRQAARLEQHYLTDRSKYVIRKPN